MAQLDHVDALLIELVDRAIDAGVGGEVTTVEGGQRLKVLELGDPWVRLLVLNGKASGEVVVLPKKVREYAYKVAQLREQGVVP